MMGPDADDLRQIVEDVLLSVTGAGAGDAQPPAPADGPVDVLAGIHISGAWNGSVLVCWSSALAGDTAASMLDVPVGDLTDADLSDAIGEVANMIGGSVKALLPEPSVLSLPMVTFDARRATVPGTELVRTLDLGTSGRRLQVRVLQRTT